MFSLGKLQCCVWGRWEKAFRSLWIQLPGIFVAVAAVGYLWLRADGWWHDFLTLDKRGSYSCKHCSTWQEFSVHIAPTSTGCCVIWSNLKISAVYYNVLSHLFVSAAGRAQHLHVSFQWISVICFYFEVPVCESLTCLCSDKSSTWLRIRTCPRHLDPNRAEMLRTAHSSSPNIQQKPRLPWH